MVRREPGRGMDMHVLQKVAGKPGWLTRRVVATLFVAIASCGAAFSEGQRTGGPTPSAPGAEVYFIDLKDGATVPAKLKIYFGLRNMGVAPAGSDRENSGHHHLLGDKDHIPHTPPVMSPLIRVRVVDPSARKPAPADARVYFVGLEDGSVLPQKATIHFGLVNMGVAPAGIDRPNTGHHHLLIDTKLPPLDEPIPNDFNHLHFGAGQTEAIVTLSPGRHTLQLLLGDENHVPHNPPIMSKPIRVYVGKPRRRG